MHLLIIFLASSFMGRLMGADAPYRSDGAVRIVGGGAVPFPTRLGDAAADCQNRAIITPRLGGGRLLPVP